MNVRDDGLGDGAADPAQGEDLVHRRGAERIHRSEVACEELRGGLSDVPDAQPKQQPRQGLRLRRLDGLEQVFR